ncbi:galanin receptor 2a-like [Lytechinus pictus]|uniref:galanin receptor 2a-like n=1 Tax=Lytechinus pictus TaxID=7653 RepID=UPI0030BA269C
MKMSSKEPTRLLLLIFVIGVSNATDTATPSQSWTTLEDWTTSPEFTSDIQPTSNTSITTEVFTVSEDGVRQVDAPILWLWSPVSWSWVLILQLLFAIIGIIGNFLVLLVLFQRRRHCRSTDTLVAALATADFLTSVFLIPIPKAVKIPDTWTGYTYCKILFPNFPLWTSVSGSTYTLMAIAIERFIAVVYPFYFSRRLSRRVVSMWIGVVWMAAFLSGLRGVILFRVDKETNRCSISYRNNTEKIAYGCFVFAIRIVIPTLTMFITQTAIAFTLHRQSTRFASNAVDNSNNEATFHVVAKNRVLKLMMVVILIYVLCWSPNQIAFFGYNLGFVPTSYRYSNLNSVFTLLGFFNSCANPIIYTARHPEFRKAIVALVSSGPIKTHSLFGHGDMDTSVTTLRKSEAEQSHKE